MCLVLSFVSCFVFFFFKKDVKEVRLSCIILAGVGYNVGVDVRLERDTEKSLYPFMFFVLLGFS